MKLYVGNLPFSYKDEDLRQLFAKFASVTSVTLVKDRDTNNFRGFAFVEFSSNEEAEQAINELNNTDVNGKAIIVNEARPKTDRPAFRSGGDRPFRSGPSSYRSKGPRRDY